MLDGDVGQRQQLGREELAGVQEAAQPPLEPAVEEAPVLGDQHRGEHPERVRRELVAVEGPEGGGDHRDGHGCRVAQVVEAAREHAERPEDPGDLCQLPGGPDPDRPVPLRRDPRDAPQPLRVGALAARGLAG